MINKKLKIQRRHIKIRTRVVGTKDRPRLCAFRSAKHIYAQVINDETSKVLVSASDKEVKGVKAGKNKEGKEIGRKVNASFEVGKLIAKKAKEMKIEKVVFDRGGIMFHGRIKYLADGAREGGLIF